METWDQWCARHARQIGSDDYGYEALFAWQVLPRVLGLNPAHVTPQLEVLLDGRRRRIDFAVRQPGVKLALEIDGWDKSGTGRGMSREQHQDFLARQNALVLAGWTVIRFTPADVRDRPALVAERLEEAIATAARTASGSGATNHAPRSAETTAKAADTASRPAPASRATRPASAPRAAAPAQPARTASPAPGTVPTSAGSNGTAKWIGGAVAVGLAFGVFALANQGSGTVPFPDGTVTSCSDSGVVRGNISQSGERIYHMPGDAYYDVTNPEQCFTSAEDAEAAGYRRSKV